MSSSRNEPRSSRPTSTNSSVSTVFPPNLEETNVNEGDNRITVEVENTGAEAISTVGSAPISQGASANSASEGTSNQGGLGVFEQMLRTIQEMVEGNRREIQMLKDELTSSGGYSEESAHIEARLAAEERRNKELLERIVETEGRLATTEAQNITLSNTVKTQDELLERKKSVEFTDSELAELRKYSAIIVFDTCSIMNFPDILQGVNLGELVVVPKDVNNELEHHKSRFGVDERKIKAQRAITAIFNYSRRFPTAYAEGFIDLVPEVYRAKADEKEQNDNMILSVALRYKVYTDIPVIFITDDRSLSNKAAGEGLDVWTAKDFINPTECSFEDDAHGASKNVPEESKPEKPADVSKPAVEDEKRKKAQEEFLSQKISTKVLRLEASQISILQNNGVKTVADFMAKTESDFAGMKVKKGIPFTARFLKEQDAIRHKLETLK